MQHGLFSKCHDLGLSVMPIDAETGRPILNEWGSLADELISIETAEKWDDEFPIGDKYGLGLIFGPASGIIAIDDDTTDPEIKKIIPKSMYSKRGLPGRCTGFFRYRPDVPIIGEGKTGVRIQSTRSYTILPPSKHRKFDGHYVWIGKSLLDLDRSELPEFPSLEWMNDLPHADPITSGTEGRNDHLKRMIVGMRMDGKNEDEIAKFIYEWDSTHHKPRLFTDPKESFRAKNETEALDAAYLMVTNVTGSLLKSKKSLNLGRKKEIEIFTDPDKFTPRALPIPQSGLIRTFVDAVNSSSRFDTSCIGLGGALSLISVLCANRVKLNNTWPNIYVLSLARSGSGKGAIPDLLKEVLAGTNLLGSDMYRSSQSFIHGLVEQPQRLDVLDEASPFFDSMKSSANYTSDLADIVNRLFSVSKSRFDGISSVKHGQKTGACNNPCVSIYASTHHDGFLRAVQGYLGTSGLMPRFLIFEQPKDPNFKLKKINQKLMDENIESMKAFVRMHLSVYPLVYDDRFLLDLSGPANKKPRPLEMPIEEFAGALLENYEEKCANQTMILDESKDAPYSARRGEYATKIALLSAIAACRDRVMKEDVEFAIELVEACYFNAQLIRDQITNSGRVTGPWFKVRSHLLRKGAMSRVELIQSVDMKAVELDALLKPYMDDKIIQSYSDISGRRPKTMYRLLN